MTPTDTDYRTEYLVKMAMDASTEELLRLSITDVALVFAVRDAMANLLLSIAVRLANNG